MDVFFTITIVSVAVGLSALMAYGIATLVAKHKTKGMENKNLQPLKIDKNGNVIGDDNVQH